MNKVSHHPPPFHPRALPDVELALVRGLGEILGTATPPVLFDAIQHAVLAGGSRFRPRLVFAVAASVGEFDETFATHAAAAVEFLHAASLVHDDLPAFDDASMRRGVQSVHEKHGEALAILAGDALIVGAYQVLHAGSAHHPRCHEAMRILFRAGGAAEGLAKGQALELVPSRGGEAVERYHHAKTGVLFEAAASLGALAAGADPAPWMPVGRELGMLYQRLDDLADVLGDPARIGKPVGNDARHDRPTSVEPPDSGPRLVRDTLAEKLEPQVQRLRSSVPANAAMLSDYVESVLREATGRLLPESA